MTNNDLLIRLRYALDIKDVDMVKIFGLGGVELTRDEVKKILFKRPEEDGIFQDAETEKNYMACNFKMLDGFLNGFITFKRGAQEPKAGQASIQRELPKDHPNNLFLKKVKVALSLTTDDLLAIFKAGGAEVTKSELSALFRKPDHKHYRKCLDSSIRKFLMGMAGTYRPRG